MKYFNIDDIEKYIKKGFSRTKIAKKLGVSKSTVIRWLSGDTTLPNITKVDFHKRMMRNIWIYR